MDLICKLTVVINVHCHFQRDMFNLGKMRNNPLIQILLIYFF